MAEIVILGAGLTGLSAAMLLVRDGHRVTVLERDPDGPDGDAERLWTGWRRRGVSQFTQLHLMLGRWAQTMAAELPEVLVELENRGGARLNVVHLFPSGMTGGVRPGDERFELVTGRRPVVEGALAAVAARAEGVTIRRGCAVAGLLAAHDSRVPHVTGVRTADGELIRADLVVDASGRRTAVPDLLTAVGARRPHEERDSAGFVYYTRHFRSADGGLPALERPMLQFLPGYGVLTLPADNGTWGVGLVTSSRDHALRGAREVDGWSRAMTLVPGIGAWLDGEPITGVRAFAATEDRYRRYLVDGEPVCTGLVPLGDAWACTNPALGRGATIGLLHAVTLRDTLRGVPATERAAFATAFDEATETRIAPWCMATRTFDRHRLAEMDADLAGRPYVSADPAWSLAGTLATAALHDPDALRAHVSVAHLLATPAEVLSVPGMMPRVVAAGAGRPRYPADAPHHDELVAAVGQEAAA
ncbi:FAD-dependent oxidoreductase [Microlunatus ginsengisoli]|uniref:FAD-dependent oxidoreductase n=1 Tax=Microlunatus ginsengisoli TaxID=363863 RepID=A0ABP6ZWY4_9ACTN